MWWLSRPIQEKIISLSQSQNAFLEKLSRKTWRYFEELVNAENNWLPPDNIQENRDQIVAPRTSPTNIGMALLADLAAYDFGYCSSEQLLVRTQKVFATLSRMERYRGHLFNWYNTQSLEPLTPRYVSMVDSGNLAADLLVLSSGFLELSQSSILHKRLTGGLRDTLQVLLEVARGDDRPAKRDRLPLVTADILRKLEHKLRTYKMAHYP